MSLHVFANFVTPFGTAANNRGDNEGTNITPLQKLIWLDATHTTVSAESIRFALRRQLAAFQETNRNWNEELRRNEWRSGNDIDGEFAKWTNAEYSGYIDDDLLGFMAAEAGKAEGEETDSDVPTANVITPAKGKKVKGTATTRRSPLEVTRAISLTPWSGDITFNAASPMATPSAAKKGTEHPVPYGTEVHATRYQYGIALTPERLRDKSRAAKAIESLCNLGTVAGNHGRFLFDFSPDVVVFRITADPAPRFLYCFDTDDGGKSVTAGALVQRIKAGDIDVKELIVGVGDLDSPLAKQLAEVKVMETAGVKVMGVKAACKAAVDKIDEKLGITAKKE